MEIQQAIIDSINEMGSNGKLKEIIDQHTKSAIERIVADTFRWGDVNKALENLIKEAAGFDPRSISLPNMQVLIAQQASAAYEEAIAATGIKESKRIFDQFLRTPGDGPLKLSDLIEMMKDEIDKGEDNIDQDVTLVVEPHSWSKDSFSVYFDHREDIKTSDCRVYLHVSGEKILSAKLAGAEYGESFSSRSKGMLRLGYPDKLENTLIHAYTTKRAFIIDESHCNTTIHTHKD